MSLNIRANFIKARRIQAEEFVGPTLASGTGGASVFVSSKQPSPFVVTSVGGSLTYSKMSDGQIVMSGPAVYG